MASATPNIDRGWFGELHELDLPIYSRKGSSKLPDKEAFTPISLAPVPHREGGITRRLLIHLSFFLAYVALHKVSDIFQISDLRSTPWNPETGIAVVAGTLLGWTAIPVILLANLVGNILAGPIFSIKWEIISSTSHTLIFTGSAAALQHFAPFARIPTTRSIIFFLGYALLATTASVLAKLLIAVMALRLSLSYLFPYSLALSVGNLVGIMTIAPLFLAFHRPKTALGYLAGSTMYQWVSASAVIVTSIIVFGLKDTDEFKFFYLVFLPVIAFAVKDGFVGAVFSVLLSNIAMIAILYWRASEPSTVTELQLLMISLSATGLILGVAVTERQRVALQLEESRDRLRDSQAALMQASRISLASEMAAALAHELNQPLSSIRGFVRSVRRKLDNRRVNRIELRSDIDSAVKQVDVAAGLIRATRRFLERGDVRMEKMDMKRLIATCSELIAPELRISRINWMMGLPEDIPPILGNSTQIQQVILNLVRNAKEAIIEGKASIREISLAVSTVSRPGYLELAISDSGPGISQNMRELLFKPLKSSKSEGLGLGLSLCNTIVLSHGGDIWCDEDSIARTRFAFTLPVTRETQRSS